MLKYLFSCLLLLSSCSLYWGWTENIGPSQDNFFVFEAPHGFIPWYDPNASMNIAHRYSSWCQLVVNGSYFGWTRAGEYYPAWAWIINGQYMTPPPIWKLSIRSPFVPVYDDPNITHFVGFSGSQMQIFANRDFQKNPRLYDFAFQAWPLVLSGGVIEDFWRSWHAREKHERTLLGKTQSGKIFFFVSTLPRTLDEVGSLIFDDERFSHDPITVLNLDGGPSTAFFDGKIWFHSNKRLPIVFCINK